MLGLDAGALGARATPKKHHDHNAELIAGTA
jgi:hypothetical protein